VDVLLRELFRATPIAFDGDVTRWWRAHRAACGSVATIDDALLGGAHADRLGLAFGAGYRAALQALVPSLPRDAVVSLCATESGGAHPRAIATTLVRDVDDVIVSGEKRWSTMAPLADALLVVARDGTDDAGRPRLHLVQIPRSSKGLSVEPAEAPPFAPEIPHAVLRLDGVRVAATSVLDGDGFDRFLKPFRTIEDLHVHAAALAYVFGVAQRSAASRELRESMLASIVLIRSLASYDPSVPEVHVVLAGAIDASAHLLERAEPMWSNVSPDERERWERDRPLLHVASKVRAQRRERAWERVEGGR
jgi:hypothetical protein